MNSPLFTVPATASASILIVLLCIVGAASAAFESGLTAPLFVYTMIVVILASFVTSIVHYIFLELL